MLCILMAPHSYAGTTEEFSPYIGFSLLFQAGAQAGKKVMLGVWVEKVYETSCNSNVHCNDDEFSKWACPPLYKLNVCSTGFVEERKDIEKIVANNGGKYSSELRLKTTDILICKR